MIYFYVDLLKIVFWCSGVVEVGYDGLVDIFCFVFDLFCDVVIVIVGSCFV